MFLKNDVKLAANYIIALSGDGNALSVTHKIEKGVYIQARSLFLQIHRYNGKNYLSNIDEYYAVKCNISDIERPFRNEIIFAV